MLQNRARMFQVPSGIDHHEPPGRIQYDGISVRTAVQFHMAGQDNCRTCCRTCLRRNGEQEQCGKEGNPH